MPFEIIQILKDDASIRSYVDEIKAFRLLSLQTSPESFGSNYARESAFPDEVWYERLSNPKAITFIAVQLGNIVSSITALGPLPHGPDVLSAIGNPWVATDVDATVETTSLHWRINGMFTLPQARGQGTAKALIEAAKRFGIAQAEASGKELVLSIAVHEDNAPAKTLYAGCGFVAIEEETNRGDSRKIILMQWTPTSL